MPEKEADGLRAEARRHLGRLRSAVRNRARARGVELVQVAPRGGESLLGLHLWHLFSALDVTVVVDVGARTGEFGSWLRRNGYQGRIVSFEPVAANFRRLSERASSDTSWQTYRMALGSSEGTGSINVTGGTQFSSFRRPSHYAQTVFGSEASISSVEDVKVGTLDSVWDEAIGTGAATYLKTDTQGWDHEVVRGASEALRHVVAVQMEVSLKAVYDESPPLEESLRLLRDLGFSVSGFFPVTLDHDLSAIEMDCVAVKTPVPGGPPSRLAVEGRTGARLPTG